MLQLALSHDGSELIMEEFVPHDESEGDSNKVNLLGELIDISTDQLSFEF